LKLNVKVKGGRTGKVTAQSLRPGTAAAPGLTLTLTVKP
jgi:multidrug resistance efflux pump